MVLIFIAILSKYGSGEGRIKLIKQLGIFNNKVELETFREAEIEYGCQVLQNENDKVVSEPEEPPHSPRTIQEKNTNRRFKKVLAIPF